MVRAVRTALISVSDKAGLVPLCQGLATCGVRLLSTGGTARVLREAGLPVTEVAEWTGAPEILDGRVKTLHPKIHGGLLGRATPAHEAEMAAHGIQAIDLLIVNLYPFLATIARQDVTLGEAIEQIDIGGPAMLRSASKNHERVTVVTDPADYDAVLAEIQQHGGTSLAMRRRLAQKAFAATAAYDTAIATFLSRVPEGAAEGAEIPPAAPPTPDDLFPARLSIELRRKQILRYGENPHQQAALYVNPAPARVSLPEAEVLQGKELSYNNLMDLDAALALVLDIPGPGAAIIKHMNPCGAAVDHSGVLQAYRAAKAADPVSAFGGIVALNRPVDEDLAAELIDLFLECVIAPDYSDAARAVLQRKQNLRVLRYHEARPAGPEPLQSLTLRSIAGGLLVQTEDTGGDEARSARAATTRAPSDEERRVLDFAWRVAKHVRSNAIVLCRGSSVGVVTVGIGAGQMSRVDSVQAALRKAGDRAASAVMASDAFFPFRDGIDEAAKAGVTAVIQPGGSLRDAEVIAAANEHGMAMLLTQVRHFRH
jgi:phosphoribosylaminoimidazolecarboxamide formyltransferase/IMP cyclohydrolase